MLKTPEWMTKKGITWIELIKVGSSMGLLMFLVIVMIAGAIGANT